jgi:hypothetical protein
MYDIYEYTELIGKTAVNIENINDEELVFTLNNGDKYKFFHYQDCCESVDINDIVGDINDLIGSPLLLAEEIVHNNENPEGVIIPDYQDSYTWTFYKFATIKGAVTIRWYGTSNGYYSESVDFCKLS